MKTKIKYSILLVFSTAIIPFLFTSCEDDNIGDTTPPIINLIEPAEGDILKIGSDVHLDLELSDNEMLASYKVDIHNSFDGHIHTKSLKSEGETVAFSFQKSWNISEQKNALIHHHEIVIPDNTTPGNYHIMVYCTDKAGNESYVARKIILSDEGKEHKH